MNPDTAKIIDRLVMSRDGLQKLDIADYAMIRDARDAMADAANALTNYAKTFAVIQETDQAAAPHMLPAPEGVSEAKRDVADLIGRIIAARDDFKNRDMFGARYLADVLADAANALSSYRERLERAERERDEARQGERNLSEHARRVANEANEAFGVVEHVEEFWDACGYPSNRGHLTPAEQVSAIIRERDDAEARAQAAEAKVKEAGEIIAPFAAVAEHDIGGDEADTDKFQPIHNAKYARAEILTVGHLRAALRFTETQEGE